MGKGKSAFFASLFGFKEENCGGRRQLEEAAAERPPQQWYYQGTTVQPRNDYYDRYGNGDRDIDKKATEFIERVHRGMHTNDQDG
jgi:hypothetical protein